jgi:nucleoside-diphosphate-sugar epimerase
MEVLVTGATGYLGGHVVQELVRSGHVVRALVRPGRPRGWLEEAGARCCEGDLFDERSLHDAARGVDGLVHCAARTGYWSRQDGEQRRVNVDGTAAALRVAHRRSIARVVHVSSIVTVGLTREPRPLTEDEPWVGRHRPRAMYVDSKREAEERALAAAKAGLPLTVVNPGALFGPRADGVPRGGFVARVASGRARRLHPGGSTVLDARDAARGCALALERGRAGERYLLGGPNLTWLEWAAALAARLGVPPPTGERSPLTGRALALGAGLLDAAGLSRPPWAPEPFRFWGWYTWSDGAKSERELGFRARELEALVSGAVEV